MASSILTSMMRTMPSAAAARVMPSGCATASRSPSAPRRRRAASAAEEIVAAEIAEHQVAVGDGRHVAAAAVAGRARHRAGALRPDLQLAEAVDPGDGAAAGAHRVDVHHRHRDVAALDLAAAGDERLAVLDQRDVAGGAAHVEGDDVLEAGHAAGIGAGGDAAGRPRQHRGHRLARGGREGRHAAVRLHDVFLPRRDAGARRAGGRAGRCSAPGSAADRR